MRRLAPIVLAGMLFGCSAAPRAPVARAKAAPTNAIAHAEPAPTHTLATLIAPPEVAQVPRPLIEVRVPARSACALATKKWQDAPVLRISPNGVAFASVHEVPVATVHFPIASEVATVTLQLDMGPLELRGIAPSHDVDVYSARPLMMGGIYIPFAKTSLEVKASGEGKLRLALRTAPKELTDLVQPLETVEPCASAALKTASYAPKELMGAPIGQGALSGAPVPLSTAPGGGASASLLLPSGGRSVDILAREGKWTRIAWTLDNGVAVGWVPTDAVLPPRVMPGTGFGSGRGYLGSHGERPSRIVTCDHDVRMGVSVAKESAIVGTVRARKPIDLFEHENGRVRARVRDVSLELLNDAKLFVIEDEIADCVPWDPS